VDPDRCQAFVLELVDHFGGAGLLTDAREQELQELRFQPLSPVRGDDVEPDRRDTSVDRVVDVPESRTREKVDDEVVGLLVRGAMQSFLEGIPLRLGPVDTTRLGVIAQDVNVPAGVVGHEVRICQPRLARGEIDARGDPEGQLVPDRHASLLLRLIASTR